MASAESFFFPLDVCLGLGTEGYSPRLLQKAVRQASKMSFKDASDDLRELAEVNISPTHLQRLSERIGEEWQEARDEDSEAFRKDELKCAYAEAPRVAAVMLDGGRVQIRAEESGRGVQEPSWQEVKVACCLSLSSTEAKSDPQPEPPRKFLEPTEVARLAMEVKRRGKPALGRQAKDERPKKKRARRKKKPRIRKLVRTVVATMANSETFGWHMAAEVQRRGLDRARRKACVCDGQHYNWSLYEMHLVALGFIGILDFLHLLAYLYDAAHTVHSKDKAAGWKCYTQWLHWAWSGEVGTLLRSMRTAATKLGTPPSRASPDDPRKSVADAIGYVENNRQRMNYPEYRRLGLPISSAPVESTIKQINQRMKSTEKFWLEGGAEAILQLRAAYLSEDGRAEQYWARPRKHRRAVGRGRLRPAA